MGPDLGAKVSSAEPSGRRLARMDVERVRAFLLILPFVAETMQWGDNLVFWVGDKAIGGRMFALVNLDGRGAVMSFAATLERQAELCEREGLIPAPYLARAGWVAAERWDALLWREWQETLTAAHEVVRAKLPARTAALLSGPKKEREALIAARKRAIAAKAVPAKGSKPGKVTKRAGA